MKKIDPNISGAVKVKQLVSQVLKIDTVNYLLIRKNHRDHRGHREKLQRSVLSVYSVVKKTMQQFLISGKIRDRYITCWCNFWQGPDFFRQDRQDLQDLLLKMHPVDPVNPVKYQGLFYTIGQVNFYSTIQIETVTKIQKSQIFGSEHQNPRVSAQSAFHFRFDEYYFINPNNHAQNPANSIFCCHLCISIYEIIPQQIRHCLRFVETFPDFKNVSSVWRQLSWS